MASSGTYLNITLPDVGTTVGPTWATELNEAWQSLDSHDHSSGKGKQIPSSGIAINDNLGFRTSGDTAESFSPTNMLTANFFNNATALSGTAYINSAFSGGTTGELYYINSNGDQCQITNGTSVNVTGQDSLSYGVSLISTASSLAFADNFSLYLINSSTAVAITLPLLSSGTDGRFFIIKDYYGSASTANITINVSGKDHKIGKASSTSTSHVISSDEGSVVLVGYKSTNRWVIV